MVSDVGESGYYYGIGYYPNGNRHGNPTDLISGTMSDERINEFVTQLDPEFALGLVTQTWAAQAKPMSQELIGHWRHNMAKAPRRIILMEADTH